MSLAVTFWGVYRFMQKSVDGDTPETCRIYLEQNAFVIEHFGRLRQEHFRPGESCAYVDERQEGLIKGVYTYAIVGSDAQGIVRLVWTRTAGPNGCLSVPYLQILQRTPNQVVSDSDHLPRGARKRAAERSLRSSPFPLGTAA